MYELVCRGVRNQLEIHTEMILTRYYLTKRRGTLSTQLVRPLSLRVGKVLPKNKMLENQGSAALILDVTEEFSRLQERFEESRSSSGARQLKLAFSTWITGTS